MPDTDPITCRWCGVEILPHGKIRGTGTIWLRADDTFAAGASLCHLDGDSPVHLPDIPDLTDEVEVEAWLAGVREGGP